MTKLKIVAMTLLLAVPMATGPAMAMNKYQCLNSTWYGASGQWVFVKGWGWGCAHRTSWPSPLVTNNGTTGKKPVAQQADAVIAEDGNTYQFLNGKIGKQIPESSR